MSTEPTNTLPTNTSLPELDEETRRLLDARLDWDLRLYAKACEPQIRHDYEQATRQARAKGISPKNAVGKKLDPVLHDDANIPPYLKRSEEEWLKNYRVDVNRVELSELTIQFILGTVTVALGLWMVYLVMPEFGIALARQIVFMAPMFTIQHYSSYLKPWVVEKMGPTGCALVSPSATGAVYLLYGCAIALALLTLIRVPFMVFCVSLGILLSFCWFAVSFVRMRKRIKANYKAVSIILGMPGADELDTALPK